LALSRRKKKRAIIAGLSVAAVLAVGGGMVAAAESIQASYPPPVSDKVAEYYSHPPTPTIAAPAPLEVTPLDGIRASIASDKPMTISVLGDSTGNDAGEWVDLWAQHLAENATVTLHTWKEGATPWPTKTYGTGARQVIIWNGSQPGSSGNYARMQFHAMQPEKPDLIIYNYGHNASPNGTPGDIESLQRTANTDWKAQIPFVVTLQNAVRGTYVVASDMSVAELKAWTAARGVPVIDIRSAIPAASLGALLLDDVHPNKQGSKIWADTVIQTLG